MRLFYNLLFPVAFVCLLPGYLRRMLRRGHYRKHFGQRFGRYSPEVKGRLDALRGAVWVEAVSVGEMLVALKLIAAMRALEPDLPLVLSTTTTTGHALAVERALPGVEVVYTPVDLRGAVRRAFDTIRPSQLVIVDGGLWPNQLWEAERRPVPVALANARMSPRSRRRFARFPRATRGLFRLLNLVGVPDAEDGEMWRSLGVPEDRIQVTGSVKYDDAAPGVDGGRAQDSERTDGRSFHAQLAGDLGVARDTPVLLAGSTHPGEEMMIAEVFLRLRARFPGLFLIVVPRHVERTGEVRAALEALDLRVILRTELGRNFARAADALLVDTTGELRDWYAVATLVVIGKSFCAVGGQNPAEAIVADVPVLFGPHMENFAALVTTLLTANAAVQVPDAATLERECARLLGDVAERERLTAAARAQIALHRGASHRTAVALREQRRIFACIRT